MSDAQDAQSTHDLLKQKTLSCPLRQLCAMLVAVADYETMQASWYWQDRTAQGMMAMPAPPCPSP